MKENLKKIENLEELKLAEDKKAKNSTELFDGAFIVHQNVLKPNKINSKIYVTGSPNLNTIASDLIKLDILQFGHIAVPIRNKLLKIDGVNSEMTYSEFLNALENAPKSSGGIKALSEKAKALEARLEEFEVAQEIKRRNDILKAFDKAKKDVKKCLDILSLFYDDITEDEIKSVIKSAN